MFIFVCFFVFDTFNIVQPGLLRDKLKYTGLNNYLETLDYGLSNQPCLDAAEKLNSIQMLVKHRKAALCLLVKAAAPQDQQVKL